MFHRREIGTHGGHHVEVALARKEDTGLGVIEHVSQFILPGPEVQRHEDSPDSGGGEVGLYVLVTVDLEDSDPVFLPNSQVQQGVG